MSHLRFAIYFHA